MRFEAFGPARVLIDKGPTRLRPAHRRLLAALLLDAGKWVSVDTLIDRMWGDAPPKTARSSLYVHLSALRRLLPGLVVTGESRYRLDLDGHTFDVAEFAALAEEASAQIDRGRLREAGDLASRALTLWQGAPFDELDDVDAARAERARLRELQTRAAITMARALTLQGRVSESISHLRATLEDEPFNEPMWEELIHAYYLAGRQVDALHAYREARKVLAEELGLEPGPRLQALEERILLHDPDLLSGSTVAGPDGRLAPRPLPSFTTPFFDRPALTEELSEAATVHRLTTLVGLGGLGKTRLAVEATRRNTAHFVDGVAFVALDAIDDADLICQAIADAVSGREAPTLDDLIPIVGEHRLLLVLDNCEHLGEAVAKAAVRLLEGCPSVSLLATSRTPLGVAGESIYPLPSLEFPEEEASPAQVRRSEAVRFFVDAARRVQPGLSITATNAASIASVCRELAGIPLAIELAASRSDILTPRDLERMVKAAGGIVGSDEGGRPDRHRSLDDTVTWSLELLGEVDRQVFERMAVCAGPVELSALEAVCLVATDPLIKSLQHLSRSSLITVANDGETARYGQLPPIRQAASRRVDPSLWDELKRLHTSYFLALASTGASAGTPEEEAWFRSIDSAIDDVRAAFDATRDFDPVAGLRAAIDLIPYWRARGRIAEGRTRISVLRDLASEGPPEVEAMALKGEGTLALLMSDLNDAETLLEAALESFSNLGDESQVAATRNNLGGAALDLGKLEDALDHYTKARAWFTEIDDRPGLAATALNLGTVHLQLRDTQPAREWFETALDAFSGLANRGEQQIALERLSQVAYLEDHFAEARAWLEAARRLAVEVGLVDRVARADWLLADFALDAGEIDDAVDMAVQSALNARRLDHYTWWTPQLLESAARIAAEAGDADLAVKLIGAALTFRRATGASRPANVEDDYESFTASLRDTLGGDYRAVLATGQSLSTTGALTLIIDELPRPDPA